jgi:hypothetical protein
VGYTDYPNADENTRKFVPNPKKKEEELKEQVGILRESFEALKRDYQRLKAKL